jgi:transposase-like protein
MKRAPVIELPVAQIRLDGGTQPRVALDFDAIEDYAEAMGAGAKFPPVVAFYDGESYWLADGFHRVKAAYAAGFDTILCEVRQGTLEDAQWHSFSVNKTNGLRRTNEDKQRAVKAALLHPNSRGLSDREIARHIGASHNMVSEWRRHLSPDDRCATRTVTRRGKTYQQHTAKIGRQKPRSSQPATAAEPQAADPAAPITDQLPNNDTHARERLEALIRAVRVITDCEVAVRDLARQVASRPDRERLIASMEQANDFLKLCAVEARRAEGSRSSDESAGEPGLRPDSDAGDAAAGPAVA